ncbi:unnamed protein product [Rotaria socialis]|uniref:Uncharacterized protein n=1 Tax=Rotaria socialis TaxID=392032 RepID=A0A817UIX7_9BILA|nr:unnamed protein product [Rotaria socialis]CAF4584973.1 unnamed protein product [Rotaria socialis]
MNPHEHLLSRTVKNSPQHLTRRQRTHCLKADQKAQYNQQLLSTLNLLHWPESHYDSPIHIHHRTSTSRLYGILQKISNVHLYTIDTESGKPTRIHPHSISAIIHIQAIHDEHWTTIIIIEDYFAQQWNTAHPHTADCLARHQPIIEESISDDFLVCLVNSDDFDDEFDPTHPIDDYNTCICPSEIRPYKTKQALWSLPKAVEFTFDLYLDKPINLTNWSCGLDLYLHTCRLDTDKRIRQALVYYAISDLFASTHLYFHFNIRSTPSDPLTYPISVNNIQPNQLHAPAMFFIITDSHGKYFPPIIQTPSYKLITYSISGLQWNLSSLRNFSILDLSINGDHLGHDGMHLDSIDISYLSNTIQEYVHDLMSKRITPVKSLSRSRTALNRRNKKRHEKLKQKQKTHVVIRHIDRIWPLKYIKAYLMYKNIKYNRLPEIWQQKLCIQFTNPVHREHAEKTLTINDFDEHSYSEWCSQVDLRQFHISSDLRNCLTSSLIGTELSEQFFARN